MLKDLIGGGLTLLARGIGWASHLSTLMQSPQAAALRRCFLFDNGSLRAASTLQLRQAAQALALRLGVEVEAVSLLHSSNVLASELGGVAARLLEPAVLDFLEKEPGGTVVMVPLFFGPSGALTDYLPERMTAWRQRFPGATVLLAKELVSVAELDLRVAQALADAARAVIAREALVKPQMVLVDHGSPQKAVTEVRNHLACEVAGLLAQEAAGVTMASMERRAGEAYAFNEPLLERCLRAEPQRTGDVVVLLQFLQPGRHAGPGGDIAEICAAAENECPGLRTWMTEPIGMDRRVIEVLAERYRAAANSR